MSDTDLPSPPPGTPASDTPSGAEATAPEPSAATAVMEPSDAPGAPATAPTSGSTKKPHRARRIISMVLVILTAILVPLASTAVWATRTVLNTDRFTSTVSSVISDPAVISVVSNKVTDETFDALASSSIIQNLPSALKPVAVIIGGALRSRVEDAVNNVLSSDSGQEILTDTVRTAHTAAMKLLHGNIFSSDAFTVQNGTVTLNLISVIREVLVKLQADGVIPSSVTIPKPSDPPGKFATALGARLPENFGQVVVYQTNDVSRHKTLDEAQRALVTLKRSVVLLVILALVALIAAVLVAVDRSRALFRIGIGVTIGALVLIVVARRAAAAVPNAASTAGAATISRSVAEALRSSLVRVLLILALIAIVTAIVARTWDWLMSWSGAHADIARIIAVALGIIILLVLGMGWGSVIFALLVVALGLLFVDRAARRSAPTANAT
jgi:hypothetical protein